MESYADSRAVSCDPDAFDSSPSYSRRRSSIRKRVFFLGMYIHTTPMSRRRSRRSRRRTSRPRRRSTSKRTARRRSPHERRYGAVPPSTEDLKTHFTPSTRLDDYPNDQSTLFDSKVGYFRCLGKGKPINFVNDTTAYRLKHNRTTTAEYGASNNFRTIEFIPILKMGNGTLRNIFKQSQSLEQTLGERFATKGLEHKTAWMEARNMLWATQRGLHPPIYACMCHKGQDDRWYPHTYMQAGIVPTKMSKKIEESWEKEGSDALFTALNMLSEEKIVHLDIQMHKILYIDNTFKFIDFDPMYVYMDKEINKNPDVECILFINTLLLYNSAWNVSFRNKDNRDLFLNKLLSMLREQIEKIQDKPLCQDILRLMPRDDMMHTYHSQERNFIRRMKHHLNHVRLLNLLEKGSIGDFLRRVYDVPETQTCSGGSPHPQ